MGADHVEAVVLGAGVVGLAVARELSQRGIEVVIVEANPRIGEETSARNNEVIHAGFLYAPGSLKAELCRLGRDRLYAYCEERGVPFRRIGKLMPAVFESEVSQLRDLMQWGQLAGVNDLRLLSAQEASELEPQLHCRSALWSPSTGIVDSHVLMLALLADAERAGAQLAVNSRVRHVQAAPEGLLISVDSGDADSSQLSCRWLVNAAGLGAATLARSSSNEAVTRPVHFAKGSFYHLSGATPFRHLIVPLATTLSEGGAFTLDLAGQGRFGPDLEWVEARDYSVKPDLQKKFAAAVQRYWPDCDPERLSPGYSGIRPRMTGPGEPPSDWMVLGPRHHGTAGLVHLLGIDTPGLTATLSIAEHAVNLLLSSEERIR